MNKKELMEKIKAVGDITEEQRNGIVCTLIGHSRIVTTCFGYVSCSRCKDQIGDTLGGCFELKECVIVGHNCDGCRKNYEKLTWRDKLYTPEPFTEEK